MSNFTVTNIYLTKKQKAYIKKEADRIGIKSSEYIRRILDKHIEAEEQNKK